jgi:hypothetical protein
VENRICLTRGVQVAGAAWWAAMRIVVGLGDLVQRIRDGHTGRVPGAEDRGWSPLLSMCGLHHACEDTEYGFLCWASKPRSIVCQWFSLKTTGTVCQCFGLKATGTVFSGLASKLVATVFPVWPQYQWLGFPGLDLKTGSYGLVIWTTKLP